jgi:hypothetical protein
MGITTGFAFGFDTIQFRSLIPFQRIYEERYLFRTEAFRRELRNFDLVNFFLEEYDLSLCLRGVAEPCRFRRWGAWANASGSESDDAFFLKL